VVWLLLLLFGSSKVNGNRLFVDIIKMMTHQVGYVVARVKGGYNFTNKGIWSLATKDGVPTTTTIMSLFGGSLSVNGARCATSHAGLLTNEASVDLDDVREPR